MLLLPYTVLLLLRTLLPLPCAVLLSPRNLPLLLRCTVLLLPYTVLLLLCTLLLPRTVLLLPCTMLLRFSLSLR